MVKIMNSLSAIASEERRRIERRTSNVEHRISPGFRQPSTVNRQLSSGFTLLEVMVAVAMLGVFLVPLLITHGDTVQNIREAREITRAGLLAQSRIGTLETIGFEELELAPKDEDMEQFPYLKMSDEVTYTEDEMLTKAVVKVFPRSADPEKEEARIGVDIETYIVSLFFEAEEEAIIEE